jgi:nicotinamidase-related amidase
MVFVLHRQSRSLALDSGGRSIWKTRQDTVEVAARSLAIIVCDMWDRHWCRGASERVEEMAPKMNEILQAARSKGALIIHAPSETMAYYRDTPAHRRALEASATAPPATPSREAPPLPIDDSDGGCDSNNNPGAVDEPLWRRQHPAIEIDQNRDVISDQGSLIYNVIQQREIRHVVIMGVHTNMCILNRSFGIKQLSRWQVEVVLCRDLTDSMYNPERPPYVDHDVGTDLVVAYVESHWCPSISSENLR